MIDQSRSLKDKIEEMMRTAATAQELFTKAALADHEALAVHLPRCGLADAGECLKAAFATDVRPWIVEWRHSKGLPENPLRAFPESGCLEQASRERGPRNQAAAPGYA
jgi:L-rhamnose isomerase/sugar isomerase